MPDTLTRLGRSLIQHGPSSDRIYALKLAPGDMPEVLEELDELAEEEGYGKIVVKARKGDYQELADRGFLPEAMVPRFFGPREDGVFMGKFLDTQRAREASAERIQAVLRAAREKAISRGEPETSLAEPGTVPGVIFREATPEDANRLAACYGAVFESYPFPIHEADHIRNEQSQGTRYFMALEGNDLVAASAMEPGGADGTVEMTDFATLSAHRGLGLATHLLSLMDAAADRARKRVAYTIARAVSYGMNITFARRAYRFGGTLVNNTQIAGSIESMNVWYKLLGPAATSDRS